MTGSCGKTTTVELITAILSTHFRGRGNLKGFNILYNLVRRILDTSPHDDFCVVEIPLGDGKSIDLPIRLSKPVIGVVTNIGMDHFSLYGGIDAIAAEKGKLVAASLGTAQRCSMRTIHAYWKCKAGRPDA